MNKVKIALALLSIAIVVGPLAGLFLVYRDNLIGLILPPQVKNILSGGGSSGSKLSQLSQDLSNFTSAQSGSHLQYNSATGAFSYPLNFTNPLTTQLSISQLSAEVVSGNNVTLGNVSIQPINIDPGANAIINATGNLDQNEVKQLEAQYQSGNLNVSLENVTMSVGGISVRINQINNVGSILTG